MEDRFVHTSTARTEDRQYLIIGGGKTAKVNGVNESFPITFIKAIKSTYHKVYDLNNM